MTNLFAVTIFGKELDWTVSTTVLILMLVQLAIIAVALLVFVLLMLRRYAIARGRQNILVAEAADEKKERSLVGVTIDTVVVKREFTVGDEFDYDGLIVTAVYDSEPTQETVTDFTVEKPRMDVEGKPTVTVRYGKFSAVYTISVRAAEEPRVPVGLSLDVDEAQREFTVGDAFSSDGLIVTVNYNREPFTERVYDYTVEAPAMDEAGTQYVTVRRGDFFATYPITLVEPPKERELVGIELDLSVVKTDFVIGEAFDSEGLGVIGCYDAAPETEPIEDFTVEAPDLTHEGMFNVVVTYGGFTQTYPIFVTAARTFVGISLDTSVVRREFTAGEEFNCVGLIVNADYDAEPFTEQIEDYEVSAPDMNVEGEAIVTVTYCGASATYPVTIAKPVVEEPVAEEPAPEPVAEPVPEPAEDETETEGGTLRYDRSFTARLIQSSDETKQWYTVLKNELLSYNKVKERMSWKRESFHAGREGVAKFSFRGKALCLSLALDPAELENSQYKVEDISENRSFADTPCMYRIKNERRVKRACELIALVMARLGLDKTDRIAEDYYLPYEGIYELVNKGLAKRILVSGEDFGSLQRPAEETVAEVAAAEGSDTVPVIIRSEDPLAVPVVIEEESVEGGTLRYDKSFKAKVIQSDDETKRYYSTIKNELLSYEKVHDRLSWKRETYKAAGAVVAKLGYRGNALCLYLPLDVASFEGSRYKVEDVSANRSFEDTPCMFRIKNEKRLRLAADLIAIVMQDRGLERQEREPVDYYEPYQDIVKLISAGLVRREIKAKDAESLFNNKD